MLSIKDAGNTVNRESYNKYERLAFGGNMRYYDLKQKEVINIQTCRSLGCISDLDIDCKTGCILALIVPGPGKFCSFFGRDFEFFIPWKCIVQIGADIILVDIKEEDHRKKCG